MNGKYEFSQDAIDNFMFIHAYWKNSCDGINAAPENKWGYKRGDKIGRASCRERV